MKILNSLKVAVFSLLLFFTTANAQSFLLDGDNYIIDKRVQIKIAEIGNELKKKTDANIYIYAKSSYGIDKKLPIEEKNKLIENIEKKIIEKLEKPYSVLFLSLENTQHVNLISSKKLKDIVNKDDILDGYVVPLLASKDKNQLYAKASAAILNGYAQMADTIAKKEGIELQSSIGSQGKVAGTIWKVFMYSVVLIGIVLYTFAMLRRKK